MITTEIIIKKTGLQRSTISRWVREGYLPQPKKGPAQNGKGRISWWPDWIIDKILQLNHLKSRGNTLSWANYYINKNKQIDSLFDRVINNDNLENKSSLIDQIEQNGNSEWFRIVTIDKDFIEYGLSVFCTFELMRNNHNLPRDFIVNMLLFRTIFLKLIVLGYS